MDVELDLVDQISDDEILYQRLSTENEPSEHERAFNKAYALEQVGDYKEAIVLFQQVLRGKIKCPQTIRHYLMCIQAVRGSAIMKSKDLQLAYKGWQYVVRHDKYQKYRKTWPKYQYLAAAGISLMLSNHYYEQNHQQHNESSLKWSHRGIGFLRNSKMKLITHTHYTSWNINRDNLQCEDSKDSKEYQQILIGILLNFLNGIVDKLMGNYNTMSKDFDLTQRPVIKDWEIKAVINLLHKSDIAFIQKQRNQIMSLFRKFAKFLEEQEVFEYAFKLYGYCYEVDNSEDSLASINRLKEYRKEKKKSKCLDNLIKRMNETRGNRKNRDKYSDKYPCKWPGCGRGFIASDKLRQHTNSYHYAVLKFKCHICHKKFGVTHVKQTHLKKKHNYEKTGDGRGGFGDEEESDESDCDEETFVAELSCTPYISLTFNTKWLIMFVTYMGTCHGVINI